MRTIISASTFLLFLISCDTESISSGSPSDIPYSGASSRILESPANADNPYDAASILHNAVLEAYLPLESETMAASEVISKLDSLANLDSRFTALVTSNYTAPTASRISDILADPAVSTAAIISASGMSTAAKTSLTEFLDDVIALYEGEGEFADAFDFIARYETDVDSSTTFSTTEKKILMITSSIARHGYWFSLRNKKRKPRDRDWDYLITTLTSGTEGATHDTASAIMMAVASAALANQ